MSNRKFKTYLITNIPETDWKKFKRWTALKGYNSLNTAFSDFIKTAGNDTLQELRKEMIEGETVEQTT